MSAGKLYRLSDNQFVAKVNYHFQDESGTSWWGELTLNNYLRINENDGYIIELEDMRKGNCRLRKRVNRAVSGVPPRYIYRFTGISALE
jgi:hypothetical protein